MDVDLVQILENLSETVLPERPEGFGVTILEFLKISKVPISYDKARELLDKAVQDGILVKTKMATHKPGGSCSVYHKPGGEVHGRKEESKRRINP